MYINTNVRDTLSLDLLQALLMQNSKQRFHKLVEYSQK